MLVFVNPSRALERGLFRAAVTGPCRPTDVSASSMWLGKVEADMGKGKDALWLLRGC
jgi:hypothetical protein